MAGPYFDLNPDEDNQRLNMVNFVRCNGSCNMLDDLSSKICVPNKIELLLRKCF